MRFEFLGYIQENLSLIKIQIYNNYLFDLILFNIN